MLATLIHTQQKSYQNGCVRRRRRRRNRHRPSTLISVRPLHINTLGKAREMSRTPWHSDRFVCDVIDAVYTLKTHQLYFHIYVECSMETFSMRRLRIQLMLSLWQVAKNMCLSLRTKARSSLRDWMKRKMASCGCFSVRMFLMWTRILFWDGLVGISRHFWGILLIAVEEMITEAAPEAICHSYALQIHTIFIIHHVTT